MRGYLQSTTVDQYNGFYHHTAESISMGTAPRVWYSRSVFNYSPISVTIVLPIQRKLTRPYLTIDTDETSAHIKYQNINLTKKATSTHVECRFRSVNRDERGFWQISNNGDERYVIEISKEEKLRITVTNNALRTYVFPGSVTDNRPQV